MTTFYVHTYVFASQLFSQANSVKLGRAWIRKL